ncbi:hypothetical protein PtB15_4B567 [Puccinia triticina]|nr:hypothetical protein PtB15_4B567 [Puccinia triticina]
MPVEIAIFRLTVKIPIFRSTRLAKVKLRAPNTKKIGDSSEDEDLPEEPKNSKNK